MIIGRIDEPLVENTLPTIVFGAIENTCRAYKGAVSMRESRVVYVRADTLNCEITDFLGKRKPSAWQMGVVHPPHNR